MDIVIEAADDFDLLEASLLVEEVLIVDLAEDEICGRFSNTNEYFAIVLIYQFDWTHGDSIFSNRSYSWFRCERHMRDREFFDERLSRILLKQLWSGAGSLGGHLHQWGRYSVVDRPYVHFGIARYSSKIVRKTLRGDS